MDILVKNSSDKFKTLLWHTLPDPEQAGKNRSPDKVSINPEGRVLIADPDYELLHFIEKVISGFVMNSSPAGIGFVPSFQIIKKIGYADLSVDDIADVNEAELWTIHNRILEGPSAVSVSSYRAGPEGSG